MLGWCGVRGTKALGRSKCVQSDMQDTTCLSSGSRAGADRMPLERRWPSLEGTDGCLFVCLFFSWMNTQEDELFLAFRRMTVKDLKLFISLSARQSLFLSLVTVMTLYMLCTY